MPKISKDLALTAAELDDLMLGCRYMRVATLGPGDFINLTPLTFGWAGGRVYFFCRGQKVVNLRRNSTCTVLVDRNEEYYELQGAMFQGRAVVLESMLQEQNDAHLETVRWQIGRKNRAASNVPRSQERDESTAGGRTARWVVLTPERCVTWDNRKLDQHR